MPYSMPAMISAALCAIDLLESGNQTEIVTYEKMNERFRELIHLTGMGLCQPLDFALSSSYRTSLYTNEHLYL